MGHLDKKGVSSGSFKSSRRVSNRKRKQAVSRTAGCKRDQAAVLKLERMGLPFLMSRTGQNDLVLFI